MVDRLSAIFRRRGIPLLTNDAVHHHLKVVAVDSGKEKAHMTAPGLLWVILFLAAFTFLAWQLKHEYWRDVH